MKMCRGWRVNRVWVLPSEMAQIKACPPEDFVGLMIRLRGDAIKPLLIEGFQFRVIGKDDPVGGANGN